MLGIRLREILREELGGTYGVIVGFDNSPPLKGYGAMVIQFGSSPENVDKLVAGVAEGDRAAQGRGAVGRRCEQGEGARAARPGDQREAELVLAGLDADRAHVRLGPGRHRPPHRAHRALTPEIIKAMFQKYFPMDRYTLVTLKPE